jgi:hypothetical protein
MKVDLYIKAVLTTIALCLLTMLCREFASAPVVAHAGGIVEVEIVGVGPMMKSRLSSLPVTVVSNEDK